MREQLIRDSLSCVTTSNLMAQFYKTQSLNADKTLLNKILVYIQVVFDQHDVVKRMYCMEN